MMKPFLLDLSDHIARQCVLRTQPQHRHPSRDPTRPFGGIQIILVGDFAQLPPVDKDPASRETFCFDAASFKAGNFHVVHLQTVFRTTETDFVELLHRARFGNLSSNDVDLLKSRMVRDVPERVPRIYPLRRTVDQHNARKMDQLEGACFTFQRTLTPDTKDARDIAEAMGFEENVHIKNGAMVMLTINWDTKIGWVLFPP